MSQSEKLFERARKVMPGGISRNTVFRLPHPVYAVSGQGCRVTDVDGIERIDFSNNMASLIHGHAHPAIVEAVTRQLESGSAFATATVEEIRFAEFLCERVPSFDKIRFVNSGTEAVMACIKAARAYTGRPKIAKVEGAYHGSYDYAEVSQTSNPQNWGQQEGPNSVPVVQGTPQGALADVVVIPFNNWERSKTILEQHAEQIACVMIDPLPHRVGFTQAQPVFVRDLYQWTRRNGALFIFDEVITFRNEYSGMQSHYPERPDLTALGKVIGGGFPVGALAGRSEVMDVMDPTKSQLPMPHSGTFSANPITMTAGLQAMKLFDQEAVKRLNQLGEYVREQICQAIAAAKVPASVAGAGSMFRVHLKPEIPAEYRACYLDSNEQQRLNQLVDHLIESGFLLINTCSGTLSTAMTESEIDQFADSLEKGLRKLEPVLSST